MELEVIGELAIAVCCIGVAGLFYLNRDRSVRKSKALWLPVVWISLAGSRGVSEWFGLGSPTTLKGTLEGSPVDAAVLGVLVLMGVIVLLGRRRKTSVYLGVMLPIVVYSLYCAGSVAWAAYPLPALKRWMKDVGDVAMVLIVATDPRPIEAVRRIFTRVGFILLPFSIVLIRYTTMGRLWDNDGKLSIVGVTTNKNMLGLIVFVLTLGALWNWRWLLMNKSEPARGRKLVAASILLVCGLYLLDVAHSSTSVACFMLGSILMFVTHLRWMRCRPSRVHLLCASIVFIGGGALLFGGLSDVASALGRDSNLSGRTFMWDAMLRAVSNPLIGVGFDSFWTSPNAETFHHALDLLHWYHPEEINEAHNGYLEVYLNLGWVGVSLITLILFSGYLRACKALRRDGELGSLMLAYIITGAIYSITEAGFRTLSPMWIFILLAIVTVSGAEVRVRSTARRRRIAPRTEVIFPPVPEDALRQPV
jgi:exopolysaccharide production protein ExoQ